MTDWIDLDDQYPDWCDAGAVELLSPEGIVVKGEFILYDEGWASDFEYPIFHFITDRGERVDWHSFDSWRKV